MEIPIVWWLQEGELHFGELRRRIPTITQEMLAQQLPQMRAEGLMRRKVLAQVLCPLTACGQGLRSMLRRLLSGRRVSGGDLGFLPPRQPLSGRDATSISPP